MEVILQQDYPQLGFIGDRLNVKRGYARNFLLPRGIAVEVSSRSAKELKHRIALINARKEKKKQEALDLAEKLEALVLEFKLKVGTSGKSYGSIQTRELEAELKKHGFVLERHQIRLAEPIKSAGEYKINIKLHAEVTASCRVVVTDDRIAEAKPAQKNEEEKGRKRGRRAESARTEPSKTKRAQGSPTHNGAVETKGSASSKKSKKPS